MKKTHSTSFSFEVKKEVINSISKKPEIVSFINGLVFCSGELDKNNNYVLSIKNEYLMDKVIRKLDKIHMPYQKQANWKSKLVILPNAMISPVLDYKDYLTYFFAGVFCGGGSISGKNSTSYHLEIASHNQAHLQQIQAKLNEYEFNFNFLARGTKFIIYNKNKEKLIDFLAAINAKNSWYDLQNLIIKRDFENVTNRINNIDLSNINKIAQSTIRHIENINYIFEHNLEQYFDENQLVAFRIKSENKWISLAELSYLLQQQHNIYISKSGLNHWFRKLDMVVKQDKNSF
ncbi:DNA-binding protein WhiA [Mycoplasma sp. Sp48II]|uniref:DNA-binding protein WhiA n=1 Tax=unclassified Mycoplasma TaxID=2683645 RepID=UPI003A87CA6F